MADPSTPRSIRPYRSNITAYKVTMELYHEKSASDRKITKDDASVGFSTGRIVKTCSFDFVADVQNVARKAVADSCALDRLFVHDALLDRQDNITWLDAHTTPQEWDIIEKRVQQTVGAAFIKNGLHPYAVYTKPVDVR